MQQRYVKRLGMASVRGIGEFEPPSVASLQLWWPASLDGEVCMVRDVTRLCPLEKM